MAQDPVDKPVRIRVNKEACIGQGRCAVVAHLVYKLDADGYNNMTETLVEGGLAELARRGARACPESAITVETVED